MAALSEENSSDTKESAREWWTVSTYKYTEDAHHTW